MRRCPSSPRAHKSYTARTDTPQRDATWATEKACCSNTIANSLSCNSRRPHFRWITSRTAAIQSVTSLHAHGCSVVVPSESRLAQTSGERIPGAVNRSMYGVLPPSLAYHRAEQAQIIVIASKVYGLCRAPPRLPFNNSRYRSCQGRGRGFESLRPLQISSNKSASQHGPSGSFSASPPPARQPGKQGGSRQRRNTAGSWSPSGRAVALNHYPSNGQSIT